MVCELLPLLAHDIHEMRAARGRATMPFDVCDDVALASLCDMYVLGINNLSRSYFTHAPGSIVTATTSPRALPASASYLFMCAPVLSRLDSNCSTSLAGRLVMMVLRWACPWQSAAHTCS